LHRLAGWCLPLARPGGTMMAVKGASAAEEIERDAAVVRKLGGGQPRIEMCGVGIVDPASTVVVIERVRGAGRPDRARRKKG
jgi:16S rRNA (guanine527-N7)-methyltransferase